MKNLMFGLLALFLFSASTCKKDETKGKCTETGTIVDMTGLDGCGLMIEQADGSRLEVINWPEDIDRSDAGKKVSYSYQEVTDMASICMAGTIVKLECYELLEEESTVAACPAYELGDLEDRSGPTFHLRSYVTEGTELSMRIGFSGCDDDRNFNLVLSKAQMKSYPPQNPAVLEFTEQACEAYFEKELCFDMSALKQKTWLLIKNGEKTERVLYDPS